MTASSLITFDASSLAPHDIYRILIGTVVPRPIAIVSTRSASGINNVAPFSFFNAVSANPPLVALGISRKPSGEKKDTHRNIEETREFVVNTADESLLDPLVQTATAYPYGVSEFEKAGLSPVPSLKVKPPRVDGAPVQFECTLFKLMELGDGGPDSSVLILGKIVQLHLRAELYHEGKIVQERLAPIARLGGISYASLGSRHDRPVPKPK